MLLFSVCRIRPHFAAQTQSSRTMKRECKWRVNRRAQRETSAYSAPLIRLYGVAHALRR